MTRSSSKRPKVSVCLVTDPFGEFEPEDLAACFRAICRPFKSHAVVDLQKDPRSFVSSHHRRNVKKALRSVDVEVCERPVDHLEEWCRLYQNLLARHHIRGMATFSREVFRDQLQVPGIIALRTRRRDETVGMLLWYLERDVGYYHLGAYTDEGYRLRASYGLFWRSIELLAGRARSRRERGDPRIERRRPVPVQIGLSHPYSGHLPMWTDLVTRSVTQPSPDGRPRR